MGAERESGTDGRSFSTLGRVAALAAVIAAVVLVAIVLFGGSDAYTVKARFMNAGQLVNGNPVQADGVAIGSVGGIDITSDGQAEIELEIEDDHAPLRRGVRATIRQLSQSGLANRYVDLQMPPGGSEEIEDGGEVGIDETKTAVDLDELFNTLDPKTRRSLQGFFKGQARQFRGRGEQANAGFRYLNPALATSSRLFSELTRDTPVLERFLVDSSKLVTAVAERRNDLSALIGNLNETTRALGSRKDALAESIGRLPPFMRRANTTFVNLRAALEDVDPLVEASKPVAKRLGPVLGQARRFAGDARPTVRDLSRTIRRRGRGNDLVELVDSFRPLAEIALDTKERSLRPGGRRVGVGRVRGAFPETAQALKDSAPIIAFGRPYTVDFVGWFDDYVNRGIYDALGGVARVEINVNALTPQGAPIDVSQQGETFKQFAKIGQFRRCPGAADRVAADRSNLLSAEEQRELDCTEAHRAVTP
jgi:phospholipid/cholesterol/gamma-HCH transport system substrate-binding protein